MSKVIVYTADITKELAPKQAINKYFVPLGRQHNYGSCYELICWINTENGSESVMVEQPYISLIYNYEYKCCKKSHEISIETMIISLKQCIKLFSEQSNVYTLHREYMLISSNRCLDQLLLEYSFYRYQCCMINRVKSLWLYHYYTPTSPVCIRRHMRQLADCNDQLKKRFR